MSDLLETMFRELGPSALPQAGASVGASPQATEAVVTSALPALIAALARNAGTTEGASSLSRTLGRHHEPSLLEQLGPLAGALGGGGANPLAALLGSGSGASGGDADALRAFAAMLGGATALASGAAPASAANASPGSSPPMSGDTATLAAITSLLGSAGGGLGALGGDGLRALAGGGGLGALLGAAASAMGGGAGASALPEALRGDRIVSHVLGADRGKATADIANESGVDPATVAALLPVLAPILMSALGTTRKEGGLDAGGLSAFLSGEAAKLVGATPSPSPSPSRSPSPSFSPSSVVRAGISSMARSAIGRLFGR